MDPYKRRPPGEHKPKADRFDPQPMRRHEDLDDGAFSREAEAKLFGGSGGGPLRGLSPAERAPFVQLLQKCGSRPKLARRSGSRWRFFRP